MKFQKELEQLVEQLVRKAMVKVLAEMKIESLIESAVVKHAPVVTAAAEHQKSTFAELMGHGSRHPRPEVLMENRKRKVLEDLKLPDAAWSSVYADTAGSDNSVLGTDRGHSSAGEPSPEYVPENVMEAMGLMNQDFSKFVEPNKPKVSVDSGDMTELMKKREEMLKKTIKK